MSKQHFPWSPSAATRWIACPGSVELSQDQPNRESEYAAEGTASHGIGEALLKGEEVADVDPEVLQAVKVYVDEVEARRLAHEVIVDNVEKTMECLTIEGLGGTSDHHMIYVDGGKIVLHVHDYKHGQGVPVSAQENKQLLSYFVIIESHYPGWIDEFRGTIVQPRAFAGDNPVDTWTCGPERVKEHRDAILAAQTQTHLAAGDHCRWCNAKTICPELRAQALRVAQTEFTEIKDDVVKLVELLEMTPAIKSLLDAIEGALLDHAMKGNEIPGYKVVESLSKRRWMYGDDETTLKVLKKLGVGKKLAMREVLKSPAQLEKDLPPDKQEQIKSLAKRFPTGRKVVPVSARGEEVSFEVTEFTEIKE